jgi:hypothetical protein
MKNYEKISNKFNNGNIQIEEYINWRVVYEMNWKVYEMKNILIEEYN